MKTFIFAVCIFILCGALVLFNSAYITSKAVELSERADKLPDSPNDYERIYTELNSKWHELRSCASRSVIRKPEKSTTHSTK